MLSKQKQKLDKVDVSFTIESKQNCGIITGAVIGCMGERGMIGDAVFCHHTNSSYLHDERARARGKTWKWNALLLRPVGISVFRGLINGCRSVYSVEFTRPHGSNLQIPIRQLYGQQFNSTSAKNYSGWCTIQCVRKLSSLMRYFI